MADFVISLQDSVDTSKVVELQIGNYIQGAPGVKGDKGDMGDVTPAATAAKDAAVAAQGAAETAAANASAAATVAANAAMAPIANATAIDADPLSGAEYATVSRGAGVLKTTLTAIAQWVLQTYQGFAQSGTGAVAQTVQDALRERVDVRQFGVIFDGSDETAKVQAAINAAYGKTLWIDGGAVTVGALTASDSITIRGNGTLKRKAATAGMLLTLSGTSKKFDISGITFDGNQAQQSALDTQHTVTMTCQGTASGMASVILQNVTFINGNGADLDVSTGSDRPNTNEFLGVYGCKFLGGREGVDVNDDPRYLNIRSPISYIVSGCVFDFLGTPVIGRAGIVCFDGYSANNDKARGIITGNLFQGVGRSQASSTLGAVDIYNFARSTTITGNTLIAPNGRGIQVKADAENIVISGNVVDGLQGATAGGQIVVNASTDPYARGTISIAGNSMLSSTLDALVISGNNTDSTTFAKNIAITGNTISAANRRSISLANLADVVISGNSVVGSQIGVFGSGLSGPVLISNNSFRDVAGNGVNADGTCTTAWFEITGNQVANAASRGIYVGSCAGGQICNNNIINSTSNAIEVQNVGGPLLVTDNVTNSAIPFAKSGTNSGLAYGNNIGTAPSFAARSVTISSGVITAYMGWHYVDTEASAATDDLDTINGGQDGGMVSFRAASASRDVVFKDGTGNLRLNGDFTLTHSDDTITLRYMGGFWYEISRSDNAA